MHDDDDENVSAAVGVSAAYEGALSLVHIAVSIFSAVGVNVYACPRQSVCVCANAMKQCVDRSLGLCVGLCDANAVDGDVACACLLHISRPTTRP